MNMRREVSKVEDDDGLLLQNVLNCSVRHFVTNWFNALKRKRAEWGGGGGGVRSASGFRSVVDTNQSYPCAPIAFRRGPVLSSWCSCLQYVTVQHNAFK